MRKEVLLAILAGGIFGLIIAFGIWRLNSKLTSNEGINTEGSPPPSVDSTGITIAKPQDGSISTTPELKISGVTKGSSFIVVITGEEDFFGTSDATGEFSIEVELTGGINNLQVLVFDSTKQIADTSLQLVYSSEFEKFLMSDDEEELNQATESASDDVRSKVQERVKEIQKNSVFFLGTVTDISEGSFQLKLPSGEIEQVATDQDTDFASETATKKTIEEEDVAIGDFILAMGFTNDSDVLEAKRIVVISEPEETDNKALLGTIVSIDTRELVLLSNGEETTVSFGKTWKGPELKQLEEGQLVVIVGLGDGDFAARSLFEAKEVETTSSPSPTPID